MRTFLKAQSPVVKMHLNVLIMALLVTFTASGTGMGESASGEAPAKNLSPSAEQAQLVRPPTPGELERLKQLNETARVAVQKSPIRSRTVVGIHHAMVDPKIVGTVITSNSLLSVPRVGFELSAKTPPVTIVTDGLTFDQTGITTWRGHVAGDPGSRVLINVDRQTLAIYGEIETRGIVYEVRPSSNGNDVVAIFAVDPSGFPREHGSLNRLPTVDKSTTANLQAPPGGNAPVIDAMILYTPTALAQDSAGIGAQVCLAIGQLQESFINSGVQATVRLVHHGMISFTEASDRNIETNLDSLRARGNTAGDQIANLRNTHGADVVSLWVSDATDDYCGFSPLLYPPASGLANSAFSVVVRSCATSNKSFAHEVGHLLGARHDRFEEVARTSPDANFGYVKTYDNTGVNAGKDWMTIMAYQRADCPLKDVLDVNGDPVIVNGVKEQRHSCNRRLNWSNPLVLDSVSGDPMGRPVGFGTKDCTDKTQQPPIDCDGPADNVSIFNPPVGTVGPANSAAIVSGFRPLGFAGILGNLSCRTNAPPDTTDTTPPPAPTNLHIQ